MVDQASGTDLDQYDLLICDVDGTLVRTKSGRQFRRDAEDWEPIPGRFAQLEAVRSRRASRGEHLHLCLATNQGGVAFGYYEEADIRRELTRLGDLLSICGLAVCYTHPKGTIRHYRDESPRRKPDPGMLLELMGHLGVPAHRTLMVGDREEDQGAARAAGCAFAWDTELFGRPTMPHLGRPYGHTRA